MRAGWLLLAGSLLGCKPTSVDLDGPDLLGVPVDPISAACGSAPGVLARIPGMVPGLMASDNADVYVVAAARSGDLSRQDVWRVPKNGDPPGVLATDQLRLGGLAIGVASDGYVKRVYWTASADPDDAGLPGPGEVWRFNPFGPDAAVLLAGGRVGPGALIVDDTYVDWAERGIDDAGQPTAVIARMASADGGVTMLAQTGVLQTPRAFALGYAGNSELLLLWTTADRSSGNQRSAEIDSCPADGDAGPVAHVTGPGGAGVGAMAVLSVNYSGYGAIGRTLLYSTPGGIAVAGLLAGEGIGPQQGFLPVAGFVASIATADDQFFFVDPSTRALMAVSVPSDHVAHPVAVALAPSVDPGTALQADTACVYFVDGPSGALMAVAR